MFFFLVLNSCEINVEVDINKAIDQLIQQGVQFELPDPDAVKSDDSDDGAGGQNDLP